VAAELVDVAVRIVRFVDDYQPGIVACELIDADGRGPTFIDKAPIFTDESLDASSEYPRPGVVRCTALRTWRDERGRDLIAINTATPYCMESGEGLSDFVVLRSHVSAVSQLPQMPWASRRRSPERVLTVTTASRFVTSQDSSSGLQTPVTIYRTFTVTPSP
jgi:hypothetical protein